MNIQSRNLLSASLATLIGLGVLIPAQSHALEIKVGGYTIINTTGTITTGNGRVVDHRNKRPPPRKADNGNRRNTKVIVSGRRNTKVIVRDHRTARIIVRDHRTSNVTVRDHR